ncbi:hypothetical protein O9X90_25760 [Agrobacterium leguminum]|uniref:hypothetical protein n=1 Tax=Agrobacterium leguminum TaxID=2792015 RepID=UPI0022B834F4|nr:hypothetical protein [Agrobacterium leguminum]MCZ7935738.1 hypothetical protein [Agrobacterium leguminum]
MVEILISRTGKLMSLVDDVSAPESPPPIVALPENLPLEPPRKPLSAKTVKRILEKVINEYLLPDMEYADLLRWDALADGTAVAVVEDSDTTVRYHWTICPRMFTPLNLGPIDD